MHGRGDRDVSAHQLKRLVPGTGIVEQGSNDRGDVGTGNRATGDRRGCEPDPAGGRSVGEAARAQDGSVQVPGAQIGLGGAPMRRLPHHVRTNTAPLRQRTHACPSKLIIPQAAPSMASGYRT